MKNSKDLSDFASGKVNANDMADYIWSAMDRMRGFSNLKNQPHYILSFFFYKYINDLWIDSAKNGNIILPLIDEEKTLSRCRFIVPKGSEFDYIRSNMNSPYLGAMTYDALRGIEQANIDKLDGIFSMIALFDPRYFPDKGSYNSILQFLLNFFSQFNFQPSIIDSDTVARCFELLLEKIGWHEGKKGGHVNTPNEISHLLKLLLDVKDEETVYDPACGSGGLLITINNKKNNGLRLYGQELNRDTYNIARMNMFIHGVDKFKIELGDSINAPKFVENHTLRQFDVVLSNPPFSVSHWWNGSSDTTIFKWGMPPESKGDYAFVSHMLTSAKNKKGRVAVLVSHGALVRKGQEQIIRQRIIEDNLLEAVIGLPANLLPATSIPTAILLFNKGRLENNTVLFIDASREFNQSRRKNVLNIEGIDHIISTYNLFKEDRSRDGSAVENGYSFVATIEEIAKSEFNINLERYVQYNDEKKSLDIETLEREIIQLDNKLDELKSKIDKNLSMLGL